MRKTETIETSHSLEQLVKGGRNELLDLETIGRFDVTKMWSEVIAGAKTGTQLINECNRGFLRRAMTRRGNDYLPFASARVKNLLKIATPTSDSAEDIGAKFVAGRIVAVGNSFIFGRHAGFSAYLFDVSMISKWILHSVLSMESCASYDTVKRRVGRRVDPLSEGMTVRNDQTLSLTRHVFDVTYFFSSRKSYRAVHKYFRWYY